VKTNLEALTEIRDNAVHYLVAGPRLSKQVLEIGTASLRNFIELGKLWLNLNLSGYSLYLMPIGFLPSSAAVGEGIIISNDEQNVINYLADLVNKAGDRPTDDYHVALDVEISFKRTATPTATQVIITKDANATPIRLTEENSRTLYPWDYFTLTEALKTRYTDFKATTQYHAIRKQFDNDSRYMMIRLLDQNNPNGVTKKLYSPRILQEFDKTYTLKK
jgi:hypothetical protein